MKDTELERIRRAFGRRHPVSDISEDEYSALKSEISSMTLEGVLQWLPLLLIHELETTDSKNGDALVYFLDGYKRFRGEEAALLVELSRPVLEGFSREQATAVRLWLEQVAKRKYGRLCGDDLESAIAYWNDREAILR